MSGNHTSTTTHNIEVLTKNLALKQEGKTSLFHHDGLLDSVVKRF